MPTCPPHGGGSDTTTRTFPSCGWFPSPTKRQLAGGWRGNPLYAHPPTRRPSVTYPASCRRPSLLPPRACPRDDNGPTPYRTARIDRPCVKPRPMPGERPGRMGVTQGTRGPRSAQVPICERRIACQDRPRSRPTSLDARHKRGGFRSRRRTRHPGPGCEEPTSRRSHSNRVARPARGRRGAEGLGLVLFPRGFCPHATHRRDIPRTSDPRPGPMWNAQVSSVRPGRYRSGMCPVCPFSGGGSGVAAEVECGRSGFVRGEGR